jgi:hypothetical protein
VGVEGIKGRLTAGGEAGKLERSAQIIEGVVEAVDAEARLRRAPLGVKDGDRAGSARSIPGGPDLAPAMIPCAWLPFEVDETDLPETALLVIDVSPPIGRLEVPDPAPSCEIAHQVRLARHVLELR